MKTPEEFAQEVMRTAYNATFYGERVRMLIAELAAARDAEVREAAMREAAVVAVRTARYSKADAEVCDEIAAAIIALAPPCTCLGSEALHVPGSKGCHENPMAVVEGALPKSERAKPLSGAELAQRHGFKPLSSTEAARNLEREVRNASTKAKCERCKGERAIWSTIATAPGTARSPGSIRVECPRCHGTGDAT